MRRLIRLLLTTLAALSLILFAASAGLWVLSYQVGDQIYWSHWWIQGLTSNESAWWLMDGRGGAGVGHRVQSALQRPENLANFKHLVDHPESSWKRERPAKPLFFPQPGDGILRRWGFRHDADPTPTAFAYSGVAGYYREWDAPFWSLCLFFAISPTAWLLAARRRKKAIREGLCTKCGYDLRATPERCPECGAVPSSICAPR